MEREEMMKAAALHGLMESLGLLVELGVVPHGKARAMLAEVVGGSSVKVAEKGKIGFRLSVAKPGANVIGVAS